MREYKAVRKLMGSAFEFCVVHENQKEAERLLEKGVKEVVRLERLLSEFTGDSQTTAINKYASKSWVTTEREVVDLISRSLAISNLTKGCFDITVGALKKLYSFKGGVFEMPAQKTIDNALERVGYDNIQVDSNYHRVRFSKDGLRLSFAAIGKGYASDCVKKLWLREGVKAGYINASGDLNTFGKRADSSEWTIGIANPDQPTTTLMYLPVNNMSVATSGDAEQHFLHEGVRYSHNINPHTGKPLIGVKSVSVFSSSAELSDALATAVYVMGPKEGIDFVNQLPQTHAIIIDAQNNLYLSKGMNYEKICA